MNKIVVFTEQSLYKFLSTHLITDIKEKTTLTDGLMHVMIDNIMYIFSTNQKDKMLDKETLIIIRDFDSLLQYSEEDLHFLFQRIHKFSHQVHCKNNMIPHSWAGFHYNNKVSFLAFDIEKSNAKVIIEIKESESNNILIHCITEKGKTLKLDEYLYNEDEYQLAIDKLIEAKDIFLEQLEILKISQMGDNLIFDQFVPTEENIFSYNDWLKRLSKVQEAFVNADEKTSIKLRGPAGTGKTLAMEIKAIKILKQYENAKILFLTHSWTVADQVQFFVETIIDDPEYLKRIDVFPLLSLAEMFTKHMQNLLILGDDSFSGKIYQLEQIEKIVSSYMSSNLLFYKSRCSDFFLNQITSTDINEKKMLYWDLMIEFACVIGANGIMPGISARDKYLSIERRPWMMPLKNDSDKEVVINLYQEYIKVLIKNKEITSDQVINDFLNYLATYNWHYDRANSGYDYIFIDEMQLFNEQERMVFHYLTKSPDTYPLLFMAMDPKQSVIESYFDYGIKDIPSVEGHQSEQTFGESKDFILGDVFRYTNQILHFLKHIDRSFPAMGLGSDWDNNIKHTISRKGNGSIPSIAIKKNIDEEVEYAIEQAERFISTGLRIAILSLDNDAFKILKTMKTNNHRTEFIESKEDTYKLQYKKKGLVISQPYYVIGLQFDIIIIIGCNIHFSEFDSNQSYNLRRFISDLYLGSSRASKQLLLTASSNYGTVPSFINNAISKNCLVKVN